MSNFLESVRNNYPHISKVIFTLLLIAGILFIYPKAGKFKYDFSLGKPWEYEALYAPFDFAILKTNQEVNLERQQIKRSIVPVFDRHTEVLQDETIRFEDKLKSNWEDYLKNEKRQNDTNEFNRLKEEGILLLQQIYKQGIVQLEESIETQTSDFVVMVLDENNLGAEMELGEMLSIGQAYQLLEEKVNALKRTKTFKKILLRALENSINHNIQFNALKTNQFEKEAIKKMSTTWGIVLENEKIISKGEIVDQEHFGKLTSLKSEFELKTGGDHHYAVISLGQFVIILALIGVLLWFIIEMSGGMLINVNKLVFVYTLLLFMVSSGILASNSSYLSVYVIPFGILPILMRTFFNASISFMSHLVSIVLVAVVIPNGLDFLVLELVVGIVCVFYAKNLKNRAQIFTISFLLAICNVIMFTAITMVGDGSLDRLAPPFYLWLIGGGLLTLFAYPLMYVFEKIFGFISDVTLLELNDTNQSLLKKLSEKAPGTFQHSLQVANLADAVISAIGGNALLVRTGALYHDIGKINNPLFFIENQKGFNPHEEIGHIESSDIIIRHVLDGIEMAKKAKLPEQIIDFIRSHHGTTLTRYFLNSYKKKYPDQPINENLFRYPGPKPFSKESAVLMMADAVEASSRSLPTKDENAINTLIDGIIQSQIDDKQFENAPITFGDISKAKTIFKQKLLEVHHVRIAYPQATK